MKLVHMPPDTNEQVVHSKRTMREAWPSFDEEQFRADLAEQNHMLDMLEEEKRRMRRNDVFVNFVVIAGFIFGVILLVSGG